MKRYITIITMLALLGLGGRVIAQEGETPSLTLYPSIIEVETAPEEIISNVITVRNNSNLIVPVQIEVSDYSIDSQGVPTYISNSPQWSPKDWITVEPSDIILEPKEKREIEVIISVPETALGGSHFAAILFKPIMPPDYFETQSTHIIPYIGAVIGINVETDEVVSSTDFLVVEDFNQSIDEELEEVLFTTTLHNDDVYYHKIEGDITVSNLFDNIVVKEDVEGVTLFPESSWEIENTYGSRLPFGKYTAVLSVSGEGDWASETVTFWVKPTILEVFIMVFILIGAILAISAIVVLIKKRKNVVKAVKTLIKR